MFNELKWFLFGAIFSVSAAAAAVPIVYSSTAIPVSAAQDATSITYQRDVGTGQWSVRGPVCPRVDQTVMTGLTRLPCVDQLVNISTPAGAFLTQLKADYKQVVLAAGFASAD